MVGPQIPGGIPLLGPAPGVHLPCSPTPPYACPAWRWWFTHELGHALCAPTYICPRGSHIPILHSFREMLWEKVVVEDEAKEDGDDSGRVEVHATAAHVIKG